MSDTVSGTLAAAAAPPEVCSGRAYNVATGSPHSILDLLSILGRLLGIETESLFVDARPGDVRRSQADPSAAQRDLGFRCKVSFEEGLRRTAAAFTAESSDRTET